MKIKHIIFLLLLQIPFWLHAQGSVQMQAFSAQGVHISGEDIWFDIAISGNPAAGIVQVRLLDRKGKLISSNRMRMGSGLISGYLSSPTGLPSDYYFIDAFLEGASCETRLAPVMIINPQIPPAPGCVPNTTAMQVSDTPLPLEKRTYTPFESVGLDLSAQLFEQAVISVAWHDQLSELLDSAKAGFNKTILHDSRSGAGMEGQAFRVRASQQGQPSAGIEVLAGVRGQHAVLARATTDANGSATLVFPLLDGLVRIYASPAPGTPSGVVLQWEEEQDPPQEIAFPCLRLSEYHRAGLEQRLFNVRVTAAFQGEQTKAFDVVEKDTTDFYGKPDQRYWLDSYVRFPVMEEVVLEIIPPVKFRKQGDEQYLQVLNLPVKTFFDEPALVLVDGVPVPNNKKLLDLDPATVRVIDVVTRKYILGSQEFSGIVHFKTFRGNSSSAGIEKIFQGLQDPVQYQGVPVSGTQQGMPQMRNLVLHEQKGKAEMKDIRFTLPEGEGIYRLRTLGVGTGSPTIRTALLNVSR